jgi:hypothetical protein
MIIFSETKGRPSKKHGDDVIQLRFKCNKRENEPPNGELAKLLFVLGLSGNNFLWDLKKKIWEIFFGIEIEPIQISIERYPIIARNINNAADVLCLSTLLIAVGQLIGAFDLSLYHSGSPFL